VFNIGRNRLFFFLAFCATFSGVDGTLLKSFGNSALAAGLISIGNPESITVTGVRITDGNAVDCPQIRATDGTIYPISHLPTHIKIGMTVTVRGFWAVTTKCRGRVISAQDFGG